MPIAFSVSHSHTFFTSNTDIGHPAHKRSGAKTGYSMVNGVIYFAMSLCGVLAFIQSIVNVATIGPIVLFVGESFFAATYVYW